MDDYCKNIVAINAEWKNFIAGVQIDNNYIIPNKILDSWKRCKEKRTDPYLTKVPVVLDRDNFKKRLEKNKELIDASLPFVKNLYTFVKGSGFVVVLYDYETYILKIIGDEEVKKSAEKGNLIEGACWDEETAGTNGGGTVLKLGEPIQIFAGEHYCINSRKWTCSGAPIRNPEGKIIGGIDMTGPYQKANSHTLGMVVAAAYAIENYLRQTKNFEECQAANNFKNTVIESITEALITIDQNGFITMVNNKFTNKCNLPLNMIVGKNIKDFFNKDKNKDLLNIISINQPVTDAVVRIFQQNKFIDCTISCNPILSPQKNILGKIIMLNEIKRARSLVNRLTGARASFRFKNMIGKNTRFLDSIRQAKLASKSVSTVLLLGESGTGKDVFAQAIHNESSRKDGPYIAINCAAIPRDLISCELFGYSEGAFTGSKKGGNEGKFELAGGGTIFLDEITEMPLELQTTLLRVLEDKTITRIGGKEIVQLDVRIIAASNKNIREEVKKGAFREDLYYRVNVFTIEMIPLRERKNDIPILADQFIKNISEKMNRNINRVDDKIFKVLLNYAFPGNVRELQNIIERAINIAPLNEITLDLIPFEVVHGQQITEDGYGIVSIDDMERRMILNMLRSNFSKSDIANKMKISRNTLYRRLNKYERAENDGQ
jgi:transcriptional regulator of acetoin/glycerol metabolism